MTANRWVTMDEFDVGEEGAKAKLQFSPLTVVFRVSVAMGKDEAEDVFCIQGECRNEEPISILDDGASDVDKQVARRMADKLVLNIKAGLDR